MKGAMQERSVSERVVVAVAEAEGVDPRNLHPPLAAVIDPDALSHLFADSTTTGHVTFQYNGYEITVENGGSVDLETVEQPVATD